MAFGVSMLRADERAKPWRRRLAGYATVVWVNEHSHIYHFPRPHDYGNTKRGAYMCEADAQRLAIGQRRMRGIHEPRALD